jgi:hypothetical protein
LSEPELKAVELSLADTGMELKDALEAAQYARFIKPDEPESEVEAETMTAFVEAFSAGTEIWEEGSATDRTSALTALSARLEALEQLGLFVHAGAVQLDYVAEPGNVVKLPVAIVTISRNNMPSGVVLVPTEIEADGEASGPIH